MKITGIDLEARAETALRDVFDAIPFARLANDLPSMLREGVTSSDIQRVEVRVDGRRFPLIVEVSGSGEPRHARNAVLKLTRLRETSINDPADAPYPVFVAPYISPRSARICDEENVGYIDFAGNCKLAFAGVYIERTGKPNPHARRRPLRAIYSPKAERVLRELLNQPHRRWKDRDLANAAHVSIGHVSNVKHQLAAQEWIRQDPVGWVVAEPEQMLSEWVAHYRPERNRRYPFYSRADVKETEESLSRELEMKDIDYAFTAFSAAARYAPFVRYQRVALYVATVEEVQFESLKPVSSGANVELIVPRDDGVLLDGRQRRDLRVVSPVQTYLDLTDAGTRSEDAAEAMLGYIRENNWREMDDAQG